jgi:amino acid transporter
MSGPGDAGPERGLTPFTIFGIASIIAAAFALYMGAAYSGTPTFDSAALPTILGVAIAVAAFLVIGSRGAENS